MHRIWPKKVILGGKWDPRNWRKWGSGSAFSHLVGGRIFKKFLAPLEVAPLKLRSGQRGPPAPLKGGQGKPPPLHPPPDASASSKIVSLGGRQARLPHSVWWKTLENAYQGEVADIGVHWSSESTSFLETVCLTT